jgi:hypothetical protein
MGARLGQWANGTRASAAQSAQVALWIFANIGAVNTIETTCQASIMYDFEPSKILWSH